MDPSKTYENFPMRLVGISVLVNVLIYAVGAVILSGFGNILPALYLLYCLGNEVHIMKMSCVDCYYYGKLCALGRGIVAPLFFRRGDAGRFTAKTISWKELLPDMLVLLFPLVGGIALLIQRFSWSIALMLAVFVSLSLGGNYLVRSHIACKYCKQRELGCPAERFFGTR